MDPSAATARQLDDDAVRGTRLRDDLDGSAIRDVTGPDRRMKFACQRCAPFPVGESVAAQILPGVVEDRPLTHHDRRPSAGDDSAPGSDAHAGP
jgi:hypothetical protein